MTEEIFEKVSRGGTPSIRGGAFNAERRKGNESMVGLSHPSCIPTKTEQSRG